MQEFQPLQPHAGPPSPQQPQSRSLAIALVVSLLFLLAAGGVCAWLLLKAPESSVVTVQVPTGDGSDKVKKVTFVPGADLPAAYGRRDQNTQMAQTSYFFDTRTNCGITTSILAVTDEKAVPKDMALQHAKAAQNYGVTTTKVADGADLKLKDADGQHSYVFPTVFLEQSVDIAGIPFKNQKAVMAYKQFGAELAAITYSCRADTWDATHPDLQKFASGFIVKTEK